MKKVFARILFLAALLTTANSVYSADKAKLDGPQSPCFPGINCAVQVANSAYSADKAKLDGPQSPCFPGINCVVQVGQFGVQRQPHFGVAG